MPLSTLTPSSRNRKLTTSPSTHPVSVTRSSQASCPTSCPFLGNGCYAESGPSGFHTRRLSPASSRLIAEEEARNIATLWPRDGRPLRLHEVGDCPTTLDAKIVSRAVRKAQSQGAGPAWAYTHAWASVPRSAWGPVSVLGSIESSRSARDAYKRGYAPALVTPSFSEGSKALKKDGFRGIPCPAQTGTAPDCASCRLCFRSDLLLRTRGVIMFEPHGAGAGKVRATLRS